MQSLVIGKYDNLWSVVVRLPFQLLSKLKCDRTLTIGTSTLFLALLPNEHDRQVNL